MIAANKITVGQVLNFADVETIKSSVKTGISVTILPAISTHEEIEASTLKGHRILDGQLTLRYDLSQKRIVIEYQSVPFRPHPLF